MAARLIDGKSVAAALRTAVAQRVAAAGFSPRLAVILVGDDPASAVYVRTKDRAAREAAIEFLDDSPSRRYHPAQVARNH